MAAIPWERPAGGKPMPPPSTFRTYLLLFVTTLGECMKSPEQSPFLVQRCGEKVGEDLKTRHREETDTSNERALKWAWYRLLWDRKNLRVLRQALYDQAYSQPKPLGQALNDLAALVSTVIDEADAANERAPQMNARKEEELPNMDLPDRPSPPKNVNYKAIIDE